MNDMTYRLGERELRTELESVRRIRFDGVLYEILGGVKPGVDYEIASEEDGYDGHTQHPVLVKPGTLENISLKEIARSNVEPGDRLVARIISGNVPANMRIAYQGNLVLLPGRVTEIVPPRFLRRVKNFLVNKFYT